MGQRWDRLALVGAATWLSWLTFVWVLGAPAGAWVIALSGSVLVAWVTRRIGREARWIVPGVIAMAALLVSAAGGRDLLGGGPGAAPFGYANANAAFYVQASLAGLALSRSGPLRWQRRGGTGAAIGCAALTVINRSFTGVFFLFLFLPCALWLEKYRGRRAVVALCAGLWVSVLAASVSLGASYDGAVEAPGIVRVAERVLSERRLVLWQEAWTLAIRHPVLGVGEGGFAGASETARADRDAGHAHQEFLQHAAEAGIPGLFLLTSLFAWGFARAGAGAGQGDQAVFGLVGWTALGVHACIDYVLHFAIVPLAAVALLASSVADDGGGNRSMNRRRSGLAT